MDIGGPGCNPVAPEAQTPQQSKSLLATKTAASEEERNNTTNTQRRNPRRSELKRYYTIGEFSFTEKNQIYLINSQGLLVYLCFFFLLVNYRWLLRLQMPTVSIKISYFTADVKLPWRINLLYLSCTIYENSFFCLSFSLRTNTEECIKAILWGRM